MSQVLRFLSTASNEVIGGIAVALAVCTYLILGRVGLLLIGALAGIILHATWEGQGVLAGSVEDARREKGLDVVKRVLEWQETRNTHVDDEDTEDRYVLP